MSDKSESGTTYTLDNWLGDAAVVRSIWDRVEKEIEFLELRLVIKKQDKIDADTVLDDVEPNDRGRIKVYVIKVTNKLRDSDDVKSDFSALLRRFRNGPQDAKPKSTERRMMNQGDFLGLSVDLGTGEYFNWRN